MPLAGQADDLFRLTAVCHKSLLHQTGLAGQQGLAGHLIMVGVRRPDIYKVYIRIGHQGSV